MTKIMTFINKPETLIPRGGRDHNLYQRHTAIISDGNVSYTGLQNTAWRTLLTSCSWSEMFLVVMSPMMLSLIWRRQLLLRLNSGAVSELFVVEILRRARHICLHVDFYAQLTRRCGDLRMLTLSANMCHTTRSFSWKSKEYVIHDTIRYDTIR